MRKARGHVLVPGGRRKSGDSAGWCASSNAHSALSSPVLAPPFSRPGHPSFPVCDNSPSRPPEESPLARTVNSETLSSRLASCFFCSFFVSPRPPFPFFLCRGFLCRLFVIRLLPASPSRSPPAWQLSPPLAFALALQRTTPDHPSVVRCSLFFSSALSVPLREVL